MRVGNFTAIVVPGRELETGHVRLTHGSKYSIKLVNHWYDRRCDAEVFIDGKSMGTFRIDPTRSLVLERPANDVGCFTFYKEASREAFDAGIFHVPNEDRGLVKIVFKPELKQAHHSAVREMARKEEEKTSGGLSFTESHFCSRVSSGELYAGVTGLSGTSNQRFHIVPNLTYDVSEETTIHLRLVVEEDQVRPLTPVTKANPVPNALS